MKLAKTIVVALSACVVISSLEAQEKRPTVRKQRQEKRQDHREERQDKRQERQSDRQDLRQDRREGRQEQRSDRQEHRSDMREKREEFREERFKRWQDVKAEHPEFAEKAQARMDLNKDGKISAREWGKARPRLMVGLRKHWQENQERRSDMREEFREERFKRWQDVKEAHPEFAEKAQAKMDLNKDGEVSAREWRRARPRLMVSLRKHWQENRANRQEMRQDRREGRQDARQDRRETRQENRQERREDRSEKRGERRENRQEGRQDRREGRQERRQQRRER